MKQEAATTAETTKEDLSDEAKATEASKPIKMNDAERAELKTLFEKRKSISFESLKNRTKLSAQVKNPKTKNINFELLGVSTFGMQANFAFAEEFLVSVRRKWHMSFDKITKLWVFSPLDTYHEVYTQFRERFARKGVDVIGIPSFAFTLIEKTVPFAVKEEGKFRHSHDYRQDELMKPRLSSLPKRLYQ